MASEASARLARPKGLQKQRLSLLHCPSCGTYELVLKSYVGIISRRGLESLLPDTEHAVPFLLRRAYRRQPTEAICYWAVMQDAAAKEVERQLQWRLYEDAFATLHARAKHFGTLLPPEFEDTA